jgi:hypothetical protein
MIKPIAPIPYVKSKFARIEDDNYITIDPRCIRALLTSWDIPQPAVDPYTRGGNTGLDPIIAGDMHDIYAPGVRSVVTNPPYSRPDVDDITEELIRAVRMARLEVAAILVRIGWDCARSRKNYWAPPFSASIRLQFRPWWSQSRTSQPIHSYQWLIWDRRHRGEPVLIHVGADL